MKCVNYKIQESIAATSLSFNGALFDLHADWAFDGIVYNPFLDVLYLDFSAALPKGQGGIRLVFKKINFYTWTSEPGERENPECLIDISMAVPGEEKFPNKENWSTDEEFDLIFGFGTGDLRVSCEESYFEYVS